MICAVILGPSMEQAHQQISHAMDQVDLVELRLDSFTQLDLAALRSLRSFFKIPMVFTLRTSTYIGSYDYFDALRHLAALEPEFLDLESNLPSCFIEKISKIYPDIKLIISHHDFSKTPEDLGSIYNEMRRIPAFAYKMALKAHNSLDMLRLLEFSKDAGPNLIAISMGADGVPSRILGPIFGRKITYACLSEDEKSASGQLTIESLNELYHYRLLNSGTKIYGLIGDPVDQSISHQTHNHLMKSLQWNGVYVKIRITPAELPAFFQLARKLPFCGLSVTMPLKEAILPYLDEIDSMAQGIGAVNTLVFEANRIIGYNTDGIGALRALETEMDVRGKRVVIIGAGGAAKAIAFEAIFRGASVVILNRDRDKAVQLGERLGAIGRGLEGMKMCFEEGYDALINCTPISLPINASYLRSEAVIMDIKTRPKETLLLKHAEETGCRLVYGYQMFIEQGLRQYALWTRGQVNLEGAEFMNLPIWDAVSFQ